MEVVLVIAVICGIFIFFWLGRDRGSYTYGRSAAVRTCDSCGQTQHSYSGCPVENWADSWWEVLDPIKNPKCSCHKDTK